MNNIRVWFRHFIFLIICILCALPLKVNASERIGDLHYELNDDASCYVDYCSQWDAKEIITIPKTVQWEGVTYTVTGIGELAFAEVSKTKEIILPDTITSIDFQAFSEMPDLTTLVIPVNVREISYTMVDGCVNLTKLSVDVNNPYICSDSAGCIYNKDKTKLLCVSPSARILTIPEGVTQFVSNVFSGNNVLEEITIPSTVDTIPCQCFSYSNVKRVTLKEGVKKIETLAFDHCRNLEYISIPEGLTHIGENDSLTGVFVHCDNLKEVVLPSTLKFMQMNAFFFCGNLKKVVIYSRDAEIESYAFSDCSSDLVIYGYSNSTWAGSFSSFRPLDGPQAKGTTLNVSAQQCQVKVTSSSAKAPTVSYTKSTNSSAKTITIPDTVKVDGITYKVTSVASSALANNKKVTKITVGKNVTSIGKNAFKKCAKLKTVTMKSTSLKSIGSNAFYGDKNLKTITIKSSKLTSKSVGKNAFKGTNKKLTIKVPKKKVSSYKKFLKKKGNSKVKVKK